MVAKDSTDGTVAHDHEAKPAVANCHAHEVDCLPSGIDPLDVFDMILLMEPRMAALVPNGRNELHPMGMGSARGLLA